jgi:hypothetical protein
MAELFSRLPAIVVLDFVVDIDLVRVSESRAALAGSSACCDIDLSDLVV